MSGLPGHESQLDQSCPGGPPNSLPISSSSPSLSRNKHGLPGCVASLKLLNLSEPCFPYLKRAHRPRPIVRLAQLQEGLFPWSGPGRRREIFFRGLRLYTDYTWLVGQSRALYTQHPEGCYGNCQHPSGSFQILSNNRELWALLCFFKSWFWSGLVSGPRVLRSMLNKGWKGQGDEKKNRLRTP